MLRPETATSHHDDSPVHLVTTSAVRQVEALVGGAVDARRSRANVVLGTDGVGFVEDAWIGRDLAIGPDLVLRLGDGMERCVMVDAGQVDVDVDRKILTRLGQAHDVVLGLKAYVINPGTITTGDLAPLALRLNPDGPASSTAGISSITRSGLVERDVVAAGHDDLRGTRAEDEPSALVGDVGHLVAEGPPRPARWR